jgi:hypothetical protein
MQFVLSTQIASFLPGPRSDVTTLGSLALRNPFSSIGELRLYTAASVQFQILPELSNSGSLPGKAGGFPVHLISTIFGERAVRWLSSAD